MLGAGLAWKYVDAHTVETLAALAEFQRTEPAALPLSWLVLLCAALVVALAVTAVLFSVFQAGRSPLALLQSSSQRQAKGNKT